MYKNYNVNSNLWRRSIPDCDVVTRLQQSTDIPRAHVAKSEKPNLERHGTRDHKLVGRTHRLRRDDVRQVQRRTVVNLQLSWRCGGNQRWNMPQTNMWIVTINSQAGYRRLSAANLSEFITTFGVFLFWLLDTLRGPCGPLSTWVYCICVQLCCLLCVCFAICNTIQCHIVCNTWPLANVIPDRYY